MAQLFETLCMMLAFKESHSLAVHYCRLVWDVRSLSYYYTAQQSALEIATKTAAEKAAQEQAQIGRASCRERVSSPV